MAISEANVTTGNGQEPSVIAFQDLLKTGPGTIAGRYLRSFWQPVALASAVPPGRAKPIRIMSEDLTLYRGEDLSPSPSPARGGSRLPLPSQGRGLGG